MAKPTTPSQPIAFAPDESGRYGPPEVGSVYRCPACDSRLSVARVDLASAARFVHVGADCEAGSVVALREAGRQILTGVRTLILPGWLRASFDYLDPQGAVMRFEQQEPSQVLQVSEACVPFQTPKYTTDARLFGPELPQALHVQLKCVRGDNVDSTALAHYHDARLYAIEIDISRFEGADMARFTQFITTDAPRDWLYQPEYERRFEARAADLMARHQALHAQVD
jgi:hypothetical protein